MDKLLCKVPKIEYVPGSSSPGSSSRSAGSREDDPKTWIDKVLAAGFVFCDTVGDKP